MRNGDVITCVECERLWAGYERATHEHQHLLARLKSASAGKAEAALLIQQVSAAEMARKKARDALETHQLSAGHG